MLFDPKLYGSEKEPVHAEDLQALTGCSLAWWYRREHHESKEKSLRASFILQEAAREALFRALKEGIWDGNLVEKLFRDGYKQRAAKKLVDWEGRDPKYEGGSYVKMLRNFLPEARKQIASILAIDAPFQIKIGKIRCVGRIDLLYRDPEDKLCLNNLSFEKKRPSQWLIDHSPKLALQAAALLRGEVSGFKENAWPQKLQMLFLRDFLPLKPGMRLRIEHPDQAVHFNVPLWSSVVVEDSEMRGPAFYQSRQKMGALPRLEFSIKQLVAAVKSGRIVETFGEHCRFCSYQERCLAEGSDSLSRKEVEVLETALEAISAQSLAS